jgi:hypothetical protein
MHPGENRGKLRAGRRTQCNQDRKGSQRESEGSPVSRHQPRLRRGGSAKGVHGTCLAAQRAVHAGVRSDGTVAERQPGHPAQEHAVRAEEAAVGTRNHRPQEKKAGAQGEHFRAAPLPEESNERVEPADNELGTCRGEKHGK